MVDGMNLFHALQNSCRIRHTLCVDGPIRHLTGKCTGTFLLKAQEYFCSQEEQLRIG